MQTMDDHTTPTFQLHTPRYRLLDQLGEGGMGAVYRAHDRLSGQVVALKCVILAPDDQDSASRHDLRLALAHEFRTLASLRHPHIISVLDYGFDALRQPFFTMELLEEAQPIVAAGQGRPLAQRVELLLQACEALAYLHRRGVLHHDLKPENILVAGGRVRLLDFGLAVLAHQQRDEDTFGSLLYLAPEVMNGCPYTEAADLYSLGVIAYQILAGHHPFRAENAQDFLDQVFHAEPDLSAVSGPDALARLVGQLLAKEPAARPPGAQATIAALRAATDQAPRESPAIRESYLQSATFVGRTVELALLKEALEQARQGRGGAWLIGGESGVGKSRLLRELETQALVSGVAVIRSQAVEEGGATFQLWRAALRQLLVAGTPVDDLSAGVIRPLVSDIDALIERPVAPAPALEGPAAQIRLLTTIAGLFQQHPQPLLLLLEDLQWAIESLLPLPSLIRAAAERPLLLVGTYRDDERPDLPEELPGMRQLTLPRLIPAHVATLSVAMLGEVGRQPALLDRLQEETEGNTFFLVEVVRALAEEAGRLDSIGQAALPGPLMPQGIQAVIDRRLAHIPAAARPLLEQAAVAGRQLDLAVLQILAPRVDLANWWLPLCAEAAVLEVDDQRWQFSHDKLRASLIARLAPEPARRLHAAVAEALEQLYGADEGYAGRLAYHWGQAGCVEREAAASLRAGRYARRQGSLAEAVRLLTRACEITPADDQRTRCDIHLQRGAVREVLGVWPEAEADFQAALALAERPEELAGAQLALGKLCSLRGEHGPALAWLAQARAGSTALDDQRGLAQVSNAEGMVWFYQGAYEQARAHLEAGLAHGRAIEDLESIALSLNNLGNVALRQSDYPTARALYEESLALRRALGDPQGIANSLSNLGLVVHNQGDYDRALELHEASLSLRRTMGDTTGITRSLSNLGLVAATLGDYTRAQALLEECLELDRAIGDTLGLAGTLNTLGSIVLEGGDYGVGRALLEESLALRRSLHDAFGIVSTLTSLGGVALHLGDHAGAWASYAESMGLAAEIGDKEGVVYSLSGMAILAQACGAPARAAQLAGAADALLAAIGGVLDSTLLHRLNSALAAARAALGEPAFQAAWAGGAGQPWEQVVRDTLAAPLTT